jgi:conjugative transfer pilus assembly protein TraH
MIQTPAPTTPLWKRVVATLMATLLIASPLPLHAGDLNAEVNSMFNNLGAIGNYTAPGAFRGQTMNTYTGGSLFMRSPNKVYQLAAIQFPSAKAGCGGIDVFGGSFSHISATEFKNMLKNITAALPGIAFQLALEAVSPLLGGLSKWAKGLETWINNARIRRPAQTSPSRWAWKATVTRHAGVALPTGPASSLRPAPQAMPMCATRRPSWET